jgi:hypothetical protein
MWKRHWQDEVGVGEGVRGMAGVGEAWGLQTLDQGRREGKCNRNSNLV